MQGVGWGDEASQEPPVRRRPARPLHRGLRRAGLVLLLLLAAVGPALAMPSDVPAPSGPPPPAATPVEPLAPSVAADAGPGDGPSGWPRPLTWAVQSGVSERSTAITVALTWPLPWRRLPSGSPWELHLEASAGTWFARQPREGDPSRFWRVGLTPVLRYRFAPTALASYLEAGIGAHLIGPLYRQGDRRFGSVFNFGDHVAIGWIPDAQGRDEFALRLQHFSNAGLRPPNPGENFLQLRWTRRF